MKKGGLMDGKSKEYFRNLIMARLRLLEGRTLVEVCESHALPDTLDHAAIMQHHQIDSTLGTIKRAEIAELREALDKISENTYGICEECGNNIPEKRLRINPGGPLCIHCQGSAEKSGRHIRPRYFNEINISILDQGEGIREAV
jgi:DnaK suppressor protein